MFFLYKKKKGNYVFTLFLCLKTSRHLLQIAIKLFVLLHFIIQRFSVDV